MKQHSASEMRYDADILDADGSTVIQTGLGAGVTDLAGRQLVQAQLVSAETTHMVLLRYLDALQLPARGYLSITDPGTLVATLYVVDYTQDPRVPRPRVWTEVYCHVERAGLDA